MEGQVATAQTQPAAPGKGATASTGNVLDAVLQSWLMTVLGLILVGVAIRDYSVARTHVFLRVHCLVAEIVAGAGIAFCFGGAMHYLDVALAGRTAKGTRAAWYWRVLLVLQKRLLLVGQLAATALIVVVLVVIVLKVPLPRVR
jgi:hypothetical protein